MSNKSTTNKNQASDLSSNNQYLDAKSIPKFQFQLFDQQLINCIKQLYLQSKSQQKIVQAHKKQLTEKITTQQIIQSFKLIQTNLAFPTPLLNQIPNSIKNKDFNDPSNPVLTSTLKLSNKFSIFSQILSILNNKMQQLQKRVTSSQDKINLNFKQKTSSLQQQLTSFVKDYRNSFKQLNNKFQQTKINFNNKAKQIQTNTLWKINQCAKRLQDRPNVQMVRNSVSELEIKLTKMIQSGAGNGINHGNNDTTKMQQDIIKLKKLIDFNTIQLNSQIKSIQQKMQNNYMSLKAYSQQKIQLTKRFQNINVANSDMVRKVKNHQTILKDLQSSSKQLTTQGNNHNQHIKKINQKIQRFTKNDQFAKLLQKIDPHQLCRISTSVKSLQEKSISTDHRLQALGSFSQALRSKMQFWNIANGQNPQKKQQNINMELISKLIKDQINSSQFKSRLLKFQQQLIDLTSLKQGINDMIKKIGRINKDNDLTNIKYEIQGVQQYLKRQLLIVTNRLNTIELAVNSANDTKKRPLSARGKDEGKMFASLSTKKLLPVNCISCHQTNTMMVQRQRKTVFNSKFVSK